MADRTDTTIPGWLRTRGVSAIEIMILFLAFGDANTHHAYVALGVLFLVALNHRGPTTWKWRQNTPPSGTVCIRFRDKDVTNG